MAADAAVKWLQSTTNNEKITLAGEFATEAA
jgi:hypothetical protein